MEKRGITNVSIVHATVYMLQQTANSVTDRKSNTWFIHISTFELVINHKTTIGNIVCLWLQMPEQSNFFEK